MTIYQTTEGDASKLKPTWEEQYTSKTIGRNFSANAQAGIRYGFHPTVTGTWELTLERDPKVGESLVYVRDRSQNIAITYRRETIEPSFDLEPEAGNTVYVVLYVDYAVGASTEVEWRVVDESELSNAWATSAVVVCRIDVPSTGGISESIIDVGPADFAGFDPRAGSGGPVWAQVSENPDFSLSTSGWYEEPNVSSPGEGPFYSFDDDDTKISDRSLVIDEQSGNQSAGDELRFSTYMSNAFDGDLALARAWVKVPDNSDIAVGLVIGDPSAGNTKYELITGTTSEFVRIGALHRFAHDQAEPVAWVAVYVEFLSDGATGTVKVDHPTVHARRMDPSVGTTSRSPAEKAAAAYHFGLRDGGIQQRAALGYRNTPDTGAGGSLVLEGTPDKIEVPFQGPDNRNVYDDRVLFEGVNAGVRHHVGETDGWGSFVLDGLDVTQNGSSSVDVASGRARYTPKGASSISVRQSYIDYGGATGVGVDMSEPSIVYLNAASESVESDNVSGFPSSSDIVPLAYVTDDGSGNIDTVYDIRDEFQQVEDTMRVSVHGDAGKGRLSTIEGALELFRQVRSERAVIEVYGVVSLNEIDVEIPSGVEIVGGEREAAVETGPLAGGEYMFRLDQDAAIRNIKLRPKDGLSSSDFQGTSAAIGNQGTTLQNVVVEDVMVDEHPNNPGVLIGSGFRCDSDIIDNVSIRGCWFRGGTTSILVSNTTGVPEGGCRIVACHFNGPFALVNHSEVVGCQFKVDSSDIGDGGVDFGNSRIASCSFTDCVVQFSGEDVVTGVDLTMSESGHEPWVTVTNGAEVSGFKIDASGTSGQPNSDYAVEMDQEGASLKNGDILTGEAGGIRLTTDAENAAVSDVSITRDAFPSGGADYRGISVEGSAISCILSSLVIDAFNGAKAVWLGSNTSGCIVDNIMANLEGSGWDAVTNNTSGDSHAVGRTMRGAGDVSSFNSPKIEGDTLFGGDIVHEGGNLGFFGASPASQVNGYSVTNGTAVKSYDADSTTVDELADVVYAIISDLETYGLL